MIFFRKLIRIERATMAVNDANKLLKIYKFTKQKIQLEVYAKIYDRGIIYEIIVC